jgi:hypothetical protein
MKSILFSALLLAAAEVSASAQSCGQTAGTAKAQELVRQCMQISEATHPPCNAANPCDMIVDEIKRNCAMRRDARIAVPSFCNQYRR